MSESRVTIIGGGFSGSSAALHLLKHASHRLRITIVEPRERLAEGLAFSSAHPDHRLNGPASGHTVLPDDAQHLVRWCERTEILARDPEAVVGDSAFIRRLDFARYVRDTLQDCADACRHGSSVTHVRDAAIDLAFCDGRYRVQTHRSGILPSDMVVVATGNPSRVTPRVLTPLCGAQGFLGDPYDLEGLQRIAGSRKVLIVGAGLTAMDVACALIRYRHAGSITMVSRRGLRPRRHAVLASSAKDTLARINGPVPAYLERGDPTVRRWLAGLRHAIRTAIAQGDEWHAPFDAFRDVVWKLWPRLSLAEQRRFNRHLRTWYDVHRFRIPAPTDAIVTAAELRGQLRSERQRLVSTRSEGNAITVTFGDGSQRHFDAVVDATGFEAGGRAPFIQRAIEAGFLVPAANGIGISVDIDCCALDSRATPQRFLRVVGPPTAGQFADPVGAVFIGAHLARIVPDMLRELRQAVTT